MADNEKLSTMKEAMFREFFSDFDKLADRMEAIQKSMPLVAREIDVKLKPLRDELTALVGKLSEDATALVDDSKNIIAETGNLHRTELSKLAEELLERQSANTAKAIHVAASAAVVDAVNKNVHVPVQEAVNKITRLGNGLDYAADVLNKAAKQVSASWWERLGGFLAAALLGGMIALIIGRVSGLTVSRNQIVQLMNEQQIEQQAPAKGNSAKLK